MNKEIIAKFVDSKYAKQELEKIGFDASYLQHAEKKNQYKTIKIFALRPQEASILKQSALALGFDAAVHRGVLDCSVETSDVLLSGSIVQFEKLTKSLAAQPFRMKKVAYQIEQLVSSKLSSFTIGGIVFDWRRPYLMGILNVTPDSFSDGGAYNSVEKAVEHCDKLIADGADIIDIGAESTKPNHSPITEEEEISRLSDILKEVRASFPKSVISVDTRNVKTAEFAMNNGADLINNVGSDEDGNVEEKMLEFFNSNNIPSVYTHNGNLCEDVVDCTYKKMLENISRYSAPVIADIGIGFGKSIEQNYELIERVSEFKSLGVPLLIGHSRKSFLHKVFDLSVEELDEATAYVSAKLLFSGVNILRVHNVKRHKLLLDVFSKF